ncbi:universal stress protein [Nonomuraea sp. NPDC003560]|uniref:universal stress protein n=1 Tax=Nonomuraea sp. NPDC003560 TaxID=3364341 RepID=UPI0036845D7A
MDHIVLGYGGSDFSMQALDWALDEAELRGLPLPLVHAWQWPYGEAEEEAKAHLRKAADHVLWHGAECARSTSSGVRVETDLYEGPAARLLVVLPPARHRREHDKAVAVRAAQLMTSPAVTVTPGTAVRDAARLMHDKRIERLLVIDPVRGRRRRRPSA